MPSSITQVLRYRQAYAWAQRQSLRLSEVPVEHALSLPLPTLSHPVPAYVQFASPAHRAPGKPTIQGGPDRWWLFSPSGGRLLSYSLVAVAPAAPGATFETCEVLAPAASLAELRASVESFLESMDVAVPCFFAGEPSDDLAGLAKTFTRIVPEVLVPQYRAHAPDFLAWVGL